MYTYSVGRIAVPDGESVIKLLDVLHVPWKTLEVDYNIIDKEKPINWSQINKQNR